MRPTREVRPGVGFKLATEFLLVGITMDPSVSVPIASSTRLAAVATADPELDPPGLSVKL